MQGFCVDMLVFIWKKAYDRCGLVKDYVLFSLFLILMTKKFIMIVNFFVSSAPFWYLVLCKSYFLHVHTALSLILFMDKI